MANESRHISDLFSLRLRAFAREKEESLAKALRRKVFQLVKHDDDS